MAEAPLARQLADLAAATRWESLPLEVRSAAPARVLDIVGLCLAAIELDTSRALVGYAADTGGAEQATALGLRTQVPAAQAALVNGVLAHSLDYDDTQLPSIVHPSACVVPAALAAAELSGAPGAEMLTALVLGVEVTVRLAMAGYDRKARQSTYFEHGQHATSICGTVGGAVAAAKLLGLDEAGIANALAIACSMGAGIIEANRTGGTAKRMHCGWAAHSAVMAAEMARRGVTGPPTALEGRFGFFEAWLHGHFDTAAVTQGLGDCWALPGVQFKPYPANHFTHAVADAAIQLRDAGVTPGDVSAVAISVAAPTVRTVGEPLAAKRRPESGYHARFSAPYVFTAALFGGGGLGLGLDDFTDELVEDPARKALMDRIVVESSTECDALYPDALPAVVTLTERDGRRHTVRVLQNRGGPERPLSAADLDRKFTDNATRAVSKSAAAGLAAAVQRLPELDRVSKLFDSLKED